MKIEAIDFECVGRVVRSGARFHEFTATGDTEFVIHAIRFELSGKPYTWRPGAAGRSKRGGSARLTAAATSGAGSGDEVAVLEGIDVLLENLAADVRTGQWDHGAAGSLVAALTKHIEGMCHKVDDLPAVDAAQSNPADPMHGLSTSTADPTAPPTSAVLSGGPS
jgi:hypothetical protein